MRKRETAAHLLLRLPQQHTIQSDTTNRAVCVLCSLKLYVDETAEILSLPMVGYLW
jgi:hypothetical protein